VDEIFGGRDKFLLVMLGVAVGVIGLFLARLAGLPQLPDSEQVHYHANFAVFINGERLDLSSTRYMHDVSCKVDPGAMLPVDRAHMHENIHDVVHVHHEGTTWGHFFQNLDFAIGDNFLITDNGDSFFSDNDKQMKFVLDGIEVFSVFNRVIESEDRLLISFGSESIGEVIDLQLPEIPSTASLFNQSPQDTGGCSVIKVAPEAFGKKIRRAFWF
tara:strand:- start:4380 stop:5024 length:645 start_codon:yes stop_codon:yes gene_type:complete